MDRVFFLGQLCVFKPWSDGFEQQVFAAEGFRLNLPRRGTIRSDDVPKGQLRLDRPLLFRMTGLGFDGLELQLRLKGKWVSVAMAYFHVHSRQATLELPAALTKAGLNAAALVGKRKVRWRVHYRGKVIRNLVQTRQVLSPLGG